MSLKLDAEMIGLGILGIYILSARGQDIAASVANATVGAVGGIASGTVIGIGQAVGITATNRTQCQVDIDNGDTWAASFSCPLGDFLAFKKSGASQ